jgi:hypothetical protein
MGLTNSSRSGRRTGKVVRFLLIGLAGALLSILLHRMLDVRVGRVAVGALSGLLFGAALGVVTGDDRADRVFYASVFGVLCAVFASASVRAALP